MNVYGMNSMQRMQVAHQSTDLWALANQREKPTCSNKHLHLHTPHAAMATQPASQHAYNPLKRCGVTNFIVLCLLTEHAIHKRSKEYTNKGFLHSDC